MSHVISNRVSNTRRVTHMIMQVTSIHDANISPQLALYLFGIQIEPILHYGAAIWSVPEQIISYIYITNVVTTRAILFPIYFNRYLARESHLFMLGKLGENQPEISTIELFYSKSVHIHIKKCYWGTTWCCSVITRTRASVKPNVTKYSSTKAVYTELGRGPIMN